MTASVINAGFSAELQIATADGKLPQGVDIQCWTTVSLEQAGARGPGVVTVRIVDSAESRTLNESYRKGTGPTNVLSFPAPQDRLLPEKASTEPPELGDLVICLPLVRTEAENLQKPVLAHLAHMVVHGTLHLAGYTHDKSADAREMESLESGIMSSLGFADPYVVDQTADIAG